MYPAFCVSRVGILCQLLLQAFADGSDEAGRVLGLRSNAFHESCEVLRNDTLVESVEASSLKSVSVAHEFGQVIHLATFAQSTAPCEDGSHRVGRCLLALQILVVVACNGAVSSLVLVLAVRRNEHRSHHCQRAECCGNHVGHNVAVVVLASPDEAALRADNACHGVVDEGVEEL